MMAPEFAIARRYNESKHGIGLNMFCGLWEVSGRTQLHTGGNQTPRNLGYRNVFGVSEGCV
jgi:hypothetical protein